MERNERDLEIVRAMTPARKLEVMHALIRQAYELKAAWIRRTRPEMTEAEVRKRAWRIVAGDEPG